MEKIKEKTVKAVEKTHEFYCDDCGEYLDKVIERGDGINLERAKEINGYYGADWTGKYMGMCYIGCLCEKCTIKKEKKIAEKLREFGYWPISYDRGVD